MFTTTFIYKFFGQIACVGRLFCLAAKAARLQLIFVSSDMSDSLSSLTAVVVDLNPLAWGLRTVIESNNAQQQDKSNARAETIVQGLDAILTFINSFLLMTHGNQVAVIGVHPFGSGTF